MPGTRHQNSLINESRSIEQNKQFQQRDAGLQRCFLEQIGEKQLQQPYGVFFLQMQDSYTTARFRGYNSASLRIPVVHNGQDAFCLACPRAVRPVLRIQRVNLNMPR